jgi:hypothetical protein
MTLLSQADHFRLQFDSYRLTDDKLNYYVLSAILVAGVSRGREDTGKISFENLQVRVAELEQSEARLYGNPPPEMPRMDAVVRELEDLSARGIIELDIPQEDFLIATPLIAKWPAMESVRTDRNGKLLRRTI